MSEKIATPEAELVADFHLWKHKNKITRRFFNLVSKIISSLKDECVHIDQIQQDPSIIAINVARINTSIRLLQSILGLKAEDLLEVNDE